MKLAAPSEHSIKVDQRKFGLFVLSIPKIHVRNEGPFVVLLFRDTRVELRTAFAWSLAWKLYRAADDCMKAKNEGLPWEINLAKADFVVLTINGEEIHLPALAARQLAVALWRRSDAVDDYQLEHKVRFFK